METFRTKYSKYISKAAKNLLPDEEKIKKKKSNYRCPKKEKLCVIMWIDAGKKYWAHQRKVQRGIESQDITWKAILFLVGAN